MKLTRKQFLRTSLASLAGLSVGKLLSSHRRAKQPSSSLERPDPPLKQLGMVIDTRKCLQNPGCTKCLAACHQVHNIPYISNPRHKIDWIWGEPFPDVFASYDSPYIQVTLKNKPVLVLCNHCDQPPCVRVCPTGATWKRKKDGIVMMDWHRCIGCRYCMVACPYDARSFNWVNPRPYIENLNPSFPTRTQGVVEKCIFCSERLDRGLLPACVEACPVKALVFGDVNDPSSEVRKLLGARLTLRRKPQLGTGPNIYYII